MARRKEEAAALLMSTSSDTSTLSRTSRRSLVPIRPLTYVHNELDARSAGNRDFDQKRLMRQESNKNPFIVCAGGGTLLLLVVSIGKTTTPAKEVDLLSVHVVQAAVVRL
jgi:hypothetical protein